MMDVELELRVKRYERKPKIGARDYAKETFLAVLRVLGLLEVMNLFAQGVGGDAPFRRSLAAETAATRLPLNVCETEEGFSVVMDRRNLLIYEMLEPEKRTWPTSPNRCPKRACVGTSTI